MAGREVKVLTLRIRSSDRIIFEAVKSGKKKLETRAASPKYRSLAKGDILRFVCDSSSFQRKVGRVKKFRSLATLLKEYRPEDINPRFKNVAELKNMYRGFSGYRQKLKKYGFVAMELT